MSKIDERVITSVEQYWKAVHRTGDEVRPEHRWLCVVSSVWLALLKQGYPSRSIVLNKRLPADILEILSVDPDENVQMEAISKVRDSAFLMTLARNKNPSVRLAAVRNGYLPHKALRRLARDGNVVIANVAREKLGMRLQRANPPITGVIDPNDPHNHRE